jgi:dienelactone hydrolase
VIKLENVLLGDFSTWLNEHMKSNEISQYSFLHEKYTDVKLWQKEARRIFEQYLLAPTFSIPPVEVLEVRTYDGLHIEKLRWSLPFGPPTEAYFLRPLDYKEPLKGVLGLHDHGHNKLLGKSKIVKIEDDTPMNIIEYQELMYGGRAWANELAKQGYAVLVHDVFPFESRRVDLAEVPSHVLSLLMKENASIKDEESWYNECAYHMESVIAKSIFTAGYTWPGITMAEDRVALHILADREEVDASRIGCCGISLGGLRTNYLAGSSDMIRCAVTAGFMTTWSDFILHKAIDHTWMYTIPGLPNMMQFPDVVSMMVPNPLLVLSCIDDELYTISEVKKAEHTLRAIYEKAGCSNNFDYIYHSGPHRFSLEMQQNAFDWLQRWL